MNYIQRAIEKQRKLEEGAARCGPFGRDIYNIDLADAPIYDLLDHASNQLVLARAVIEAAHRACVQSALPYNSPEEHIIHIEAAIEAWAVHVLGEK